MRIFLTTLLVLTIALPCVFIPQAALAADDALIARAEDALEIAPVSVMEKEQLPPSGDKHDYLSIAIYWWPNPDTEDGLPWVRRDGERNPGVDDIPDKPNKGTMTRVVRDCAQAYSATGDERYAEHAAAHLRTWFLDPATRMNPHLRYAQGIPGRHDGRYWGIIDTATLGDICDYAELLVPSHHWTAADHEGLKRWFDDYLTWLRESDFGIAEGATSNNHGTWYDAQVVRYALFTGHTDYAREVCAAAGERRIARQIEPDGRQPHELRRTKSWDYSIYNLQAFVRLAKLAEQVDVDLWGYESADGRSIRAAIDYLLPYALAPETWPHKQIKDIHTGGLANILAEAARVYGDERYSAAAARLRE